MEALFRKQFWTVNLAFLALCAFLLARGGTQFLAWYLLKSASAAPVAQNRAPAPPPDRNRKERVSSVAEDGNMFGARVEAPEALNAADLAAKNKQAEEEKKQLSNADPVPTTLRIKLAGITWFEEPEFSLASITDQSGNETSLYSILRCPKLGPDEEFNAQRTPCNRLLKDNTILHIHKDRVVFENAAAGRREYISLNEEAPPAPGGTPAVPAPAPVAAETPAEGPELGKGIVKLSDNQYRIPQADIDEVMANMNSVATQARIVPAFENGKSNGFKLFSIRPGSVFGKIGIQNGDVISKINGYDMTSPDKALEVYAKLKDAKEINVELKRRGQNVNMNYGIQ